MSRRKMDRKPRFANQTGWRGPGIPERTAWTPGLWLWRLRYLAQRCAELNPQRSRELLELAAAHESEYRRRGWL
jgi:hypothetical protein